MRYLINHRSGQIYTFIHPWSQEFWNPFISLLGYDWQQRFRYNILYMKLPNQAHLNWVCNVYFVEKNTEKPRMRPIKTSVHYEPGILKNECTQIWTPITTKHQLSTVWCQRLITHNMLTDLLYFTLLYCLFKVCWTRILTDCCHFPSFFTCTCSLLANFPEAIPFLSLNRTTFIHPNK
jgi:hypothetical protein